MWPFRKKIPTLKGQYDITICAACGRPTACDIHNRWVQATIRIDDLEVKYAKLYRDALSKQTLCGGPVSEPLHEENESEKGGGDKSAEGDKPESADPGSNATYKDSIRIRQKPTILE